MTFYETINPGEGKKMPKVLEGKIDAKGLKFGLVVSR